MSTIKSSAEHLTLNADGSGKEIKFQCNGTEVAKIDSTGFVGAGSPSIDDNGNATAITIDSNENVGIGTSTPTSNLMVSESNAIASTGYAASQLLTIHQQDGAANRVAALSFIFGSDDRGPAIYAQNTSATGGVGDLLFAPSYNTESVRMLSTGGITFNGDTATANALDDYEEGTFTPTLLVGTGCSINTIYNADYTKVGNKVTIYASFFLTAPSTPASGALRFGGFPYAFKTSGENGFLIKLHYNYRPTPMAFMAPNGYCYYQNTNVGGNNLTNLSYGLDGGNYVGINITYLTN